MPEDTVETQREISGTVQKAFENAKKDDETQKTYPAYDTLELYEKVLINTPQSGNKPFKELEPYLATAYLDNDELEALKRIHSVLANAEHILNIMKDNLAEGYDGEEFNINRVTRLMRRKLFFLCYVSKSKNGFTVLELNSQHSYHHQNLYEKQTFEEEEGSMLSNLQEKVQGAQQKMPEKEGSYLPKKKSDEIW